MDFCGLFYPAQDTFRRGTCNRQGYPGIARGDSLPSFFCTAFLRRESFPGNVENVHSCNISSIVNPRMNQLQFIPAFRWKRFSKTWLWCLIVIYVYNIAQNFYNAQEYGDRVEKKLRYRAWCQADPRKPPVVIFFLVGGFTCCVPPHLGGYILTEVLILTNTLLLRWVVTTNHNRHVY